jgi:hypothetical protein
VSTIKIKTLKEGNQMKLIGSVCHNDDNFNNPKHRRVRLWWDKKEKNIRMTNGTVIEGFQYIETFEQAVKITASLYGSFIWDLKMVAEAEIMAKV